MSERYQKLVLLHSNDMHGDFLAEQVDDRLLGGLSLLSGYLSKVKAEEENTLYCIAGDMFRGSVIDAEYHGISTIEIMNMLCPDVVTLGNHETDYGVAHLLFLEKCARFPIINANMYIKTNGTRLFNPYVIKEVGGMKILFIGILTEEVIAQTKNEPLIGTILDVEDAATEVGRICNAYRSLDIDFTVLLTHIGFEEDRQLAAKLDPDWGVDIIIGGHSHTFLTEPVQVNQTLIVQAGTGTDQIGRFDIIVDTEENCISDWSWQCVPIDGDTCPRDEELEKLIDRYKTKTDEKHSHIITRFKRQLTHPDRNRETELGGLMADVFRNSLGVDLMLLASGSIRSTAMGPVVMLSDLLECFPYDDPVHMIRVSGEQLKRMILYMLRDEVWEGAHTEFYQFSSGMRVVYSRKEHRFLEFRFNGEEVPDDKMFRVGLQHYHFMNFKDSFGMPTEEFFKNGRPRILSTSSRDVLEEYLGANQNLDRHAGDRLIVE